ncbi:MAG: tripartite tricarboxylate transporter substrate binding protein [Anaerotruncus sp.]|nr:tripartite tricarboxylate transporter substrate binding protein [Anaerotruncus sp.]
MKKLSAMLLILALALSSSACSGSNPPPAASQPAVSSAPASSAASSEQADPLNGYPKENIVCIVPFDPGGSNDTLTRALLQYIDLPTAMVVQNIAGANGLVGAQEAFRADSDGYTILSANPGNLTTQMLTGADNDELYKNLVPICSLACNYELVLARPGAPFSTGEEFFSYATAHPGELKWGVAGSQSVQMGGALDIMSKANIQCTMVPYDGGAASRTALQGGHIDLLTSNTTDARELIETGEGIPMFVLSAERCQTYPDCPTLLELGVAYSKSPDDRAYWAPPGTDPAIVEYLAEKMKEVSEDPAFVEYLATFGFDPYFIGPEELSAHCEQVYQEQKPIYESFS